MEGIKEEGVKFPVYRRSMNGRHWYRIEGRGSFTEVQRIGKRVMVHHVLAKAYPEMVMIQELLEGAGGRYVPCGEMEFLSVMQEHGGPGQGRPGAG